MRPFSATSTLNLNASREAFSPLPPDYIEDVVLAADTRVAVPVPAGASYVNFSFTDDVRVKFGVSGTALALPTATSTDGSGSALNPAARRIPSDVTHIILRSAAACSGSLEFYG